MKVHRIIKYITSINLLSKVGQPYSLVNAAIVAFKFHCNVNFYLTLKSYHLLAKLTFYRTRQDICCSLLCNQSGGNFEVEGKLYKRIGFSAS